jgi:hypothetical protein
MVALSAVQTELSELVRALDRDLLRPLTHLNFGREPQYEIRPVPVIETFGKRLQRGKKGSGKVDFGV